MKFKELYLDTTYVMPFLFLDIDVKGFSRDTYKEIIKSVDRIHISEISLIEAKAKSLKLNLSQKKVNEKFNEGLFVLSSDEKVIIHRYNALDDLKFNEFDTLQLDFFDRIILAQSASVGFLLTEDGKLLDLKDIGIKIINWKSLIKEMKIQ
jgi:predicted nucleic acid-binding protein